MTLFKNTKKIQTNCQKKNKIKFDILTSITHPVTVLELNRKADVAFFAMKELLRATDSTNSTTRAVKLVLLFVIEQIALKTCILQAEHEEIVFPNRSFQIRLLELSSNLIT